MKQAQVTTWGAPPHCATVPTPSPPTDADTVQIRVLAAGLPNLVRNRAAGTHYSAAAHALPHLPGVDGVGATVPDGRLVYFATLTPSGGGGSFAEFVTVPRAATAPLPAGADAVQVAGLMNAVMASWMALAARTDASALPAGFTAVVVGATGVAGAAAVGVARAWGAGRVVGVARSRAKMAAMGLELDDAVELGEEAGPTAWGEVVPEADVVLDFLYVPAVVGLLRALSGSKPVQYLQIGTMAQRTVELPGDLLRSKDITIRGSGFGSWRMERLQEEVPRMVAAIAEGKVQPGRFQEVKLEDIEAAWGQKDGDRIVVMP